MVGVLRSLLELTLDLADMGLDLVRTATGIQRAQPPAPQVGWSDGIDRTVVLDSLRVPGRIVVDDVYDGTPPDPNWPAT